MNTGRALSRRHGAARRRVRERSGPSPLGVHVAVPPPLCRYRGCPRTGRAPERRELPVQPDRRRGFLRRRGAFESPRGGVYSPAVRSTQRRKAAYGSCSPRKTLELRTRASVWPSYMCYVVTVLSRDSSGELPTGSSPSRQPSRSRSGSRYSRLAADAITMSRGFPPARTGPAIRHDEIRRRFGMVERPESGGAARAVMPGCAFARLAWRSQPPRVTRAPLAGSIAGI